jgi:hypothetical protein
VTLRDCRNAQIRFQTKAKRENHALLRKIFVERFDGDAKRAHKLTLIANATKDKRLFEVSYSTTRKNDDFTVQRAMRSTEDLQRARA